MSQVKVIKFSPNSSKKISTIQKTRYIHLVNFESRVHKLVWLCTTIHTTEVTMKRKKLSWQICAIIVYTIRRKCPSTERVHKQVVQTFSINQQKISQFTWKFWETKSENSKLNFFLQETPLLSRLTVDIYISIHPHCWISP